MKRDQKKLNKLSAFLFSSFVLGFLIFPRSELSARENICRSLLEKFHQNFFSFRSLDRVKKKLAEMNTKRPSSGGSVAYIRLGGRANLLVLEDGAFLVWPHGDFIKRAENDGIQFRKFDEKDKKAFRIPGRGFKDSIKEVLGGPGGFSFSRSVLSNVFLPFSEVLYFALNPSAYATVRKTFDSSKADIQESMIYQKGLEDFLRSNDRTSEIKSKELKALRDNPPSVFRRRYLLASSILWAGLFGYPALFPQPLNWVSERADRYGLRISHSPYSSFLRAEVGPLSSLLLSPLDDRYDSLSQKPHILIPFIEEAEGSRSLKDQPDGRAGFTLGTSYGILPRSYVFHVNTRLSELKASIKDRDRIYAFTNELLQLPASTWDHSNSEPDAKDFERKAILKLPNRLLRYLLPNEKKWSSDDRINLPIEFLEHLSFRLSYDFFERVLFDLQIRYWMQGIQHSGQDSNEGRQPMVDESVKEHWDEISYKTLMGLMTNKNQRRDQIGVKEGVRKITDLLYTHSAASDFHRPEYTEQTVLDAEAFATIVEQYKLPNQEERLENKFLEYQSELVRRMNSADPQKDESLHAIFHAASKNLDVLIETNPVEAQKFIEKNYTTIFLLLDLRQKAWPQIGMRIDAQYYYNSLPPALSFDRPLGSLTDSALGLRLRNDLYRSFEKYNSKDNR